MGVYVEVVDAVVFVDRGGCKDGIQVEGRDAQVLQVGDLLPDAPEVAAVEVQTMGLGILRRGGIPGLDLDGGVAVHGVFAGLDVVGGIAVAKALREDLVEDRLPDPGRLYVVRQQDEVGALVRQTGRDAPLGIEIHGVVGDQVELVLHPALGHAQLRLPPDQAPVPADRAGGQHGVGPVGDRAQDHGLHRGVVVEAHPDPHRLPQGRGGIRDEIGGAVGIDAFNPLGKHRRSSFSREHRELSPVVLRILSKKALAFASAFFWYAGRDSNPRPTGS